MEDALVQKIKSYERNEQFVLILVLMEDVLVRATPRTARALPFLS